VHRCFVGEACQQGRRQSCELGDLWRRTDLDDERGHGCLAEEGQSESLGFHCGGWFGSLLEESGETLCQCSSDRRLVAIARVEENPDAVDLGFEAESEEEVGATAVGELSLMGVARPVEEERSCAVAGKVEREQVCERVSGAAACNCDEQGGSGLGSTDAKALELLERGDNVVRVVARGTQASELADGVGPDDAVSGEADIPLELCERGTGLVAKDAVDPSGVEAQHAEAALKVSDVVATERWAPQVQQAIPKRVRGLEERLPRLGSTDAVGSEVTGRLEGQNRIVCLGTEL